MNVFAIGTEKGIEELIQLNKNIIAAESSVEITSKIKKGDAVIHLWEDESMEELEALLGKEGIVVLVNSVKTTLSEIALFNPGRKCTLLGFAGLPGFINREKWDISCLDKDDLDKVIDPNPMRALMETYLARLSEIQKEEQQQLMAQKELPNHPLNTANSCLDCHGEQHAFWEKQRHSLAYLTLVRAGQPFDLSCIQCHSVGANTEKGFQTAQQMVILDPKLAHESVLQATPDAQRSVYWDEFKKAFSQPPVLSKASVEEIVQLKQEWNKLDQKHGVTHQFANVQCLNCHDQHHEHPFHISSDPRPTQAERRLSIQNKCLNCHNHDQSPAWYNKQDNGLLGEVNREVFEPIFSKLSCPSLETQDY